MAYGHARLCLLTPKKDETAILPYKIPSLRLFFCHLGSHAKTDQPATCALFFFLQIFEHFPRQRSSSPGGQRISGIMQA